LRKLKELALGQAKITGAGLKHLAQIGTLEVLDLRGTSVNSADLHELTPLVRLRKLVLAHAESVTDSGLDALTGLPQLTELDLGGTRITDTGLRSVARMPRLDDLNLCGTRITDAGLRELIPLRSLRCVWVMGTKVSHFGLWRFEQAHGQCSGVIDP
jgi:hypothetical protein